jgi:hypothetical protein
LQFEATLGKKVSEIPISTSRLIIVVYCYNPSYMGGIGKRLTVQDWPWEKSTTLHLKNNYSKKGLGEWL